MTRITTDTGITLERRLGSVFLFCFLDHKLLMTPLYSINHAVHTKFNNFPISLRAIDKLQTLKTTLVEHYFPNSVTSCGYESICRVSFCHMI